MPLWISIILLGIIEGITEFIPVSSTGHLLVAEHWLPHQTDLFNVVIQSGVVLAVIPLFHRRFHQFIFRWREPATRDYLLKIIVAFVITGIGGFLVDSRAARMCLYKIISPLDSHGVVGNLLKREFKLPEELFPVAVALFAGGVLFVVIELWLRGKTLRDDITWPVVITIGFGQLVAAIFPGASRSGTTILLALLLGLNRPLATEFSFLVGIPTMLAAGGWKIFKALHHPPAGAPVENWNMILLGTIVSAVVSFIAVKWLLRYVQTHTFIAFGWYRIVLAISIMLLLLAHHS